MLYNRNDFDKQDMDMQLVSENNPLVVVEMITYNHEKYISHAIESILMQQTNFNYKIIICEDGSTDRTAQICTDYKNKYPDKIDLYLNEKNIGVKLNGRKLHQLSLATNAKYIAMLDGDDYWTDPHKLQRQVDFLEIHPAYSVCWTNYKFQEKERFTDPIWTREMPYQEQYEISVNNIFIHYCTLTVTCLYRRTCLSEEDLVKFHHFKDATIYSLCLSKGHGAVLNFQGGVVRIHGGGIYSGSSQFNRSYDDYLTLKELYDKIPGCQVPHYLESYRGAMITIFCTYLKTNKKAKPPVSMRQLYTDLIKEADFSEKLFITKVYLKFFIKTTLYLS